MFAIKNLYLVLLILFLAGCTLLEYSPNQRFDKDSPISLNDQNLTRLLNSANDDTVRFVLCGDTQRSYDQAENFVKTVNNMQGVDFVMLAGDISDFGLLQEMKWVHRIYSKLKRPYFGVIGNHDLQANGEEAFRRMYGNLNYSFIYDSIKFVCHDTNSREYNFNGKVPDLTWLESELQSQNGIKGMITVGHVPPFALDFDKRLENEYASLLSKENVLASLYAHINNTGIHYFNGGTFRNSNQQLSDEHESPPFITTNAIQNSKFLMVEIANGKFQTKAISY